MPDTRETLSYLISVWLEIVLKGLMTRRTGADTKNLWIILDELPALGKIPSLKTASAEARKYGGCIVAGVQNIHQCLGVYGRHEALNILDQFNTRVVFRVGDAETARLTSAGLGEQEIIETQESLSYGAHTMRDGVNLNILERKRPLVLPTEITSSRDTT